MQSKTPCSPHEHFTSNMLTIEVWPQDEHKRSSLMPPCSPLPCSQPAIVAQLQTFQTNGKFWKFVVKTFSLVAYKNKYKNGGSYLLWECNRFCFIFNSSWFAISTVKPVILAFRSMKLIWCLFSRSNITLYCSNFRMPFFSRNIQGHEIHKKKEHEN